ncbi:MAG: hypothetical protein LUD77_10920 [Clostridiales bacterium]|nr:hypothetical protein [Clostridiales bacterium]
MNRKIKDSVFTRIFKIKKYLLQLYQALHPEDTNTTVDGLDIITLAPIFINDMTNDLGFAVKDKLFILVEAQSTLSMNIIVRSFMYLARTYQEYFKATKKDLYSTKSIKIPKPELYVVYTGDKKTDKEVISLSEEFFGGEQTAIEVRVKLITEKNGNGIISQYIVFSKVIDAQAKIYGRTSAAVQAAINICKNENVLTEFLEEYEKEVVDIMIDLFDQEEMYKIHEENLIAESRAKAIKEGRAEGRAEGETGATHRIIIRYMKKHNVSAHEAMDDLDIPELEQEKYHALIYRDK